MLTPYLGSLLLSLYTECSWCKDECVYWACKDETCLALQMCWRETEDGFYHCAFWDYPDDNLVCPDTAGTVVAP